MNLDLVIPNIIDPALDSLLPPSMNARPAKAMLIAVGLQESRFEHRWQVLDNGQHGPARGYWQFESHGGVYGVLHHPATQGHIRQALKLLDYPTDYGLIDCYSAIAHNDLLACAFARLLLWTLRDPLPAQGESDEAWQQYYLAWRPGKPHRATFDGYYKTAWDLVNRED